MDFNAKILIVCLNVFLLTVRIASTATTSTTESNEEGRTYPTLPTTTSPDNLYNTNVSSVTLPSTGILNDGTSSIKSNIKSTTSNVNTSDDLIPTTTDSERNFIDPQTLEKLLREDEELEDLQHGGNFENILKTIDEGDEIILPTIIDNDAEAPRWDIEWLEEDNDSREEEMPPFINVIAMDSREEVKYDVFEGHIIGIVLAATLIILLVTGYVALISWRRFILNRYGSRQILVNEEDMIIDPSDMKHFSL